MTEQPETLRLAEWCETFEHREMHDVAAELRRLYEENNRIAAAAKAEEREAICKLGEDSRYSHQYVHSFLNTIRARGQQ